MLTKRTLTKWRKEALWKVRAHERGIPFASNRIIGYVELCKRILRLTQELIDLQIMKGK